MNIFHPILNVTGLAFRLRTTNNIIDQNKTPDNKTQNNQTSYQEGAAQDDARPLENKGDRDEDERGRGVPVEQEHQRVHALVQGHLAHDLHAGVHEPDQNHGAEGLGAATHLGNKQ
jgi:hypothetical protein